MVMHLQATRGASANAPLPPLPPKKLDPGPPAREGTCVCARAVCVRHVCWWTGLRVQAETWKVLSGEEATGLPVVWWCCGVVVWKRRACFV